MKKKNPKCEKCNDTGKVEYYHDAGDHFGAGTSPWSEWREDFCDCEIGKILRRKEEANEKTN